jgi:hypothetical protein
VHGVERDTGAALTRSYRGLWCGGNGQVPPSQPAGGIGFLLALWQRFIPHLFLGLGVGLALELVLQLGRGLDLLVD